MGLCMDYHSKIKDVLEQYPEIVVALLFGSAVKERLTKASDIDIDIAVAGPRPLSLGLRATLNGKISLALLRDVDLVDLQIVSGHILQQALCTGEKIKMDGVIYPSLVKKMWFNQADMMPLTKMVQERNCRRFINV